MNDITLPGAIKNFVDATNAHDEEAIFQAFAPGAAVTDEGTTHGTEVALRNWIEARLVAPKIIITPQSHGDNRLEAWSGGRHAGGPLMFSFTFDTQDDAITRLAIARI